MLPLIATVAAGLSGALIISLSGADPIEAYSALFKGAFGGPTALGRTLEKATPLLFSGLAVALAFKAGLFNIGAEGQLLVGGLAAAWVGTWAFLTDVPGLYVDEVVIDAIRVHDAHRMLEEGAFEGGIVPKLRAAAIAAASGITAHIGATAVVA